ncbi:MAG: hypothetical protein R3C43_19205 [Chloroflexota bacterium]
MGESKYLAAAREALEATDEIELSFGPAVIRRRVSLLDLAAAGNIPITLATDFEEIGKSAKKNKMSAEHAALEHFETLVPAIDAVAIAAFVDPPVAKVGMRTTWRWPPCRLRIGWRCLCASTRG